MSSRPPRYCSYLLRCWEEPARRAGGPTIWRFSLEDPRTGERHAFADLERLSEFLRRRIEEAEQERTHARAVDE
jgi:hypothetical protein